MSNPSRHGPALGGFAPSQRLRRGRRPGRVRPQHNRQAARAANTQRSPSSTGRLVQYKLLLLLLLLRVFGTARQRVGGSYSVQRRPTQKDTGKLDALSRQLSPAAAAAAAAAIVFRSVRSSPSSVRQRLVVLQYRRISKLTDIVGEPYYSLFA